MTEPPVDHAVHTMPAERAEHAQRIEPLPEPSSLVWKHRHLSPATGALVAGQGAVDGFGCARPQVQSHGSGTCSQLSK